MGADEVPAEVEQPGAGRVKAGDGELALVDAPPPGQGQHADALELRVVRALDVAEEGVDDRLPHAVVAERLAQGGEAVGVRAGESYVDVGTLGGYRSAIGLLAGA